MGNKSVLIVEDDQEIRSLLKEAIELEGFEAHVAANGKEALGILSNSVTPSLILLDLMMPVMNGWQFLEVKNNDSNICNIPVVVITAATDSKAGEVKSQGIMKKPIDLDVLVGWIKKYCN